MVESVKTRQEKAVRRSRVTLEAKVEEQREALKAIKASVDAFLVALTLDAPYYTEEVAPITPAGQTLVETFAGPLSEAQEELDRLDAEADARLLEEDQPSAVLDPSAAA
jgi:xylose isomerase